MGPAEVMREVRNCFVTGKCEGVWRLEDGRLSPGELLMPGEWIALSGSCLNDGIWQLDGEGRLVGETRDERFTGEVWFLHPPAEFLALCEEIAAWVAAHPPEDTAEEAFGDYRWKALTDACGLPVDWREVFRGRLLPWRRMFGEVGFGC
ncbi:MAG: hypothetical protein IKH77_06205 [Clostridia bacterium]|nr:hypothetical protein [Clostridia bacterium]